MCRNATTRVAAALGLLLVAQGNAQPPAAPPPDWRPLGAAVVDLGLASFASGPVEQVWFSDGGEWLLARTAAGQIFRTRDGDRWERVQADPPLHRHSAARLEGAELRVWAHPQDPSRLYALGAHLYRSDDGGRSWVNLTAYQRQSVIGAGLRDLAFSPADPEVLVVANETGVWRSADGGLSWSGLNERLPNLPVRRILTLPQGLRGARIEVHGLGALEWSPGEKQAWRPVHEPSLERRLALQRALSAVFNVEITAVALAGDFLYAGAADGRIWVSPDRGGTWRSPPTAWEARGPVESIWTDSSDPRVALAALGATAGSRVLRTTNGGLFWDDLTSDLPAGAAAHGVTAELASGAVYVATDLGVYYTRADLQRPSPAAAWRRLGGDLSPAAARDVRLDAEGNQLFVALEGYGVYWTLAPHRAWDLRVVSAADYASRPAAPGALLSVLGTRLQGARAGDLAVPVLAASPLESQIQIPFEARGELVRLALESGARRITLELPLADVSPAIFVDRDGGPLLLDAASGVLLDGMHPARSGSRVQILATGLGAVNPPWPTGLPAPLENPPVVAAPVRAYLDRTPVEVTRAILAPGYAGLYLVEIQLPEIVNRGPAELYLESEGRQSNRVSLYVEP